ncbi:ABC transporter permease [Enterococcus timonensis]|uniref:ABC transporter permease n=1 Tax=Enterococcus timonensis TaxID=1852364 RepID=UPI0008D997AB|nr:ABC transporter permease [Enterococcus timonensis]
MEAIKDTYTMTQRVLKHTLKSIDTLITVVLMPVMIMLASVYIYGSAMSVGSISYVDYVVPGILVLTVITGSSYTAYRLNQDVTKGIFERFHSMPIAKSSILGGHVYTSVLYNFISVIFVVLAAFLFGFRLQTSFSGIVLAFLLLLFLNLAVTWIGVFFGLLAKNVETASIFSYVLMAFVFISSAFAPTSTMKSGLKFVANHQPFTWIIDGLRNLLVNQELTADFWWGLLALVIMGTAFRWAALILYKKRLA